MSYQMCNRCVMDTTDPLIKFDDKGYCNNCSTAINNIEKYWFRGEEGKVRLSQLFNRLKSENLNNKYDCIIGLSGGIDSSYLAYLASQYELRMLAVHVDAGFNSTIAENNVKNLCKNLNIDLVIEKVDLDEMMDLQRAYFLAGVPNEDIPQDHAFFTTLYSYAEKNRIKYVINGSNLATESILPTAWVYDAYDIHKKFGSKPLKNYKLMSFYNWYIKYRFFKKLVILKPLNYIDYNKEKAIKILEKEVGWQYYGGKHYESRFTKLFQAHILPVKFGYDKRKAHLSSLIVAGQMTREEAIKELDKPLYDPQELEEDIKYFINKIGITRDKFDKVMSLPPRSHEDFKTNTAILNVLRTIYSYYK
ncbi:MAG: N-acetyl sugar amidotransferase [Syntrophomonadaceae bacterium]|jgi:N-acetyl sugar amidotransferase